jgi:hypothetical protein
LVINVRRSVDDAAAGDVAVDVSAFMPDHGHGMTTKPIVKRIQDGRFEASGLLLHMPGFWELYIDISRAGVTERAQFSLDI